MTEELPKYTQIPIALNLPANMTVPEDYQPEARQGESIMYHHNGRTMEGMMVPMPVYLRSALMQGRREALGLTLEDVAEKVGVNKSTIQRYENGKIKKIPNDVLDKLEKLYSVSLRESFLDNTGAPERTEQTTPIAIVREYPPTVEQRMREKADTVEHFHYDITVQRDFLQMEPQLIQKIERFVMAMGKLDYMAKLLLEEMINYVLVQQENRESAMRSAEFMSASMVYDVVYDFLPQDQRESLWSYIVNDMSSSSVKPDAK